MVSAPYSEIVQQQTVLNIAMYLYIEIANVAKLIISESW